MCETQVSWLDSDNDYKQFGSFRSNKKIEKEREKNAVNANK